MSELSKMMAELEASITNLDSTIPTIQIMLYGYSGVGKTVQAVALAQRLRQEGTDILYVDSLEGWVSLNNHKTLKANVKRMPYAGMTQLMALAQAIHNKQGAFKNISVVVVDEFTTMSNSDLDVVATGNSRETPEWPDYHVNYKRMARAARALMRCGVHVILVGHEKLDKNKQTGTERAAIKLPVALATDVKESLHAVIRMTGEIDGLGSNATYVRRLQCYPSKTADVKSRIGTLGLYETPTSFNDKIVSWWQEGGQMSTVETKEIVDAVEAPFNAEDADVTMIEVN